MLYQFAVFLMVFYCCLLVILFLKQIENDSCEATLGKMSSIQRNYFNKQWPTYMLVWRCFKKNWNLFDIFYRLNEFLRAYRN